jgi:WD40 repeat protein/serine/threonine protein kinase
VNGSQGIDPGRQILVAKKLMERSLVSPAQLREALARRGQDGGGGPGAAPLEDILVSMGFVSRQKVDEILAELSKAGGSASPAAESPAPARSPGGAPPSSSFIPKLGKYTVIRELGRGGMGAVYEALDVQLNRKVALKLMLGHPNAAPEDVATEEERFIREAKLAAQLKHENIVAVYEAGVLDGRRYLAMELIDGKPFSLWRKTGSIPVRQQVTALRDVALAVHYAHEQGVLHRDLKPRNILVGANDRPYVMDFGLARPIGKDTNSSLTASGMVVGTPSYMSPEQCQGTGRIDWRSDIWSLGIMLFEILTGKMPFEGGSPIDIMTKVVRDPVPNPSKVAQDGAALALDSTIETICMKALSKDPKDRYATAKVMADDLTRWITGQVVKVTSPKAPRKIPLKLILRIAVPAVVLAAAAAFFLFTRPSVKAELEKADAYMKRGDYMEAVIAFREALVKDPRNEKAKAGEAEARLRAAQKEDRLRKDFEAKVKEVERARLEVEEKVRAETVASTKEERDRIAAERREIEERARTAEATAGEIGKRLGKPTPPPTPTPSPIRPAEVSWNLAVNLLSNVTLPGSAVWGQWSFRNGHFFSDDTAHARIEIPYRLPEEYDVRMAFSRMGGTGSVCLILAHGGAPFAVELGASRNRLMTLAPPATRESQDAPTSHRTTAIENNRPYTAFVRVRHDGVQVFLDSVPVLEWKGDPARLGFDPRWKLTRDLTVGFGSHASPTAFLGVEILAVSGTGRHLTPEPPSPLKPPLADASSLRPGLVGEYFHGSGFDALAVRRIDPAVAFNWGEGSAWVNGPVNSFSARWTGYLNASRGGPCVFQLSAEGAARLLLDGAQILAVDPKGQGSRRSPPRPLEPGLHALSLEFVESGYRAGIAFEWSDEDGKEPSPIAPEALFHDPKAFTAFLAPPPRELLATIPDHTNSVSGVALSPDGRRAASACEDGRLRVWDTGNRRLLAAPLAHPRGVLSLAFSPDGRLLATGGYDKKVKLWDVERLTEIRTLQGHRGFVRALAFSPDGRWLASGSFDRTVLVWEPATGKEVRMAGAHEGPCTTLAFSPDGALIASGGADHVVRLWTSIKTEIPLPFLGHADNVEGLAFSPDGRTMATAGKDHTIRIWNTARGTEVRTLAGHHGEALCVAFRPDGRVLASGGRDSMIRLWDASTGDELRVLAGHAGQVNALAFSPTGTMLISGSTDATVRLWETGAFGN